VVIEKTSRTTIQVDPLINNADNFVAKMSFCTKCGKEAESLTKYCKYCGNEL